MVYFQPFCFHVGFAFSNLLFLSYVFVLFLVCFQSIKKHCFPCNSDVFELCWLKVILMFYAVVLVFFGFLCCLFAVLNNEVEWFCVCAVCFLVL